MLVSCPLESINVVDDIMWPTLNEGFQNINFMCGNKYLAYDIAVTRVTSNI